MMKLSDYNATRVYCRDARVAVSCAAELLVGHGASLVDHLLPQQVHSGHPPLGLGPCHRSHGHQQVASVLNPFNDEQLNLLDTVLKRVLIIH